MKKIFLIFLVTILIIPTIASAALVKCGNQGQPPCKIQHLIGGRVEEGLIVGITKFILTNIVTPAAFLFILIGGILILVSGGNPELKSLGKKTLIAAVIGVAIAFGANAIIKFVLSALGAKQTL